MKDWKNFLPDAESINALSSIEPGAYFIDGKGSSKWETLFFKRSDETWLTLSWDYFDVEFKFEVYGISIEHPKSIPDSLIQIDSIGQYSQIALLLKTSWTRPAGQGEVPEDFEKVIEDNGRIADIPDNAMSAGTSLYGMIFIAAEDTRALAISIDDDERYALKSTNAPGEINFLRKKCDMIPLGEALLWAPPLIAVRRKQ